ncbi:hypothetical protein [Acinetobacter sp. CE-15]|uniref:hypothetical protein n=1 Tax=Acinetobacter sp. CE-15 TaxID=3425693 RepID=UPI003DA4EF8F
MNHLITTKKLKNHYIRDGEHPFVIITSFIFAAKKANWNKEEIQAILTQAKANDYSGFIKTIKLYVNN